MINGKRYITVNTDASYKDGVGGYAIWIKDDEYTQKVSGACKGEIRDSNAAELCAILNALYILSKKDLSKIDVIVVNTDSSYAIGYLGKNYDRSKYERFDKPYEALLKDISKPIKFKKVKGHTKGKDSRHWVNNWCDSKAKEERVKAEKIKN